MFTKILSLSGLLTIGFLTTPLIAQSTNSVEEAIKESKVPGAVESAQASLDWLKIVDEGNYGKSWDNASKLFQSTVGKEEWIQLEQATRKPLGQLVKREVVDERIAKDPKGLPVGNYMVLFYNTSFTNRKDAHELVTLMQESDGKWRVLTYHVD